MQFNLYANVTTQDRIEDWIDQLAQLVLPRCLMNDQNTNIHTKYEAQLAEGGKPSCTCTTPQSCIQFKYGYFQLSSGYTQ